jgi:hypothetical protein
MFRPSESSTLTSADVRFLSRRVSRVYRVCRNKTVHGLDLLGAVAWSAVHLGNGRGTEFENRPAPTRARSAPKAHQQQLHGGRGSEPGDVGPVAGLTAIGGTGDTAGKRGPRAPPAVPGIRQGPGPPARHAARQASERWPAFDGDVGVETQSLHTPHSCPRVGIRHAPRVESNIRVSLGTSVKSCVGSGCSGAMPVRARHSLRGPSPEGVRCETCGRRGWVVGAVGHGAWVSQRRWFERDLTTRLCTLHG